MLGVRTASLPARLGRCTRMHRSACICEAQLFGEETQAVVPRLPQKAASVLKDSVAYPNSTAHLKNRAFRDFATPRSTLLKARSVEDGSRSPEKLVHSYLS